MMPIVGKLYDKIGPKPIAIFGVISLAYTTFLLQGIDINTSSTTVMIWLILRGIAMTCITMPAQATALEVPAKDVGAASAISNTVSRVGASFGLAVLTSILTSRIAFHSAIASWGINSSNFGLAQLMQKFSASVSGAAGTSALQGLILQDAYVRGLDDIFLISTLIVIIGILPVVFLKKGGDSKQKNAAVQLEPDALSD
jgi:MFS family permease